MSHQFSKEQIKSLDSLQPDFHAVIQRLEDVIAPDITNQLKQMQKKLTEVMNSYNQEEENNWQKNFDELSLIKEENDFDTIWSMEGVSAQQMKEIIPYQINSMEYGLETITIKENITWLQSWKIANSLIKQSGDVDHIFIESFEDMGNGCLRIVTGS